jgi:site-specific DNA-methyltransferase (adenine-specific)
MPFERVELDGGRIVLFRGDCLEVLPTLEAGSVDAVVTDIPYGAVNRDSGGLRNLDKGSADDETFGLDEIAHHAWRIGRSVYIFCGTEQVSELRACLVVLGMTTRLCIWEKSNPSPMNGERFWLSSIECCVFGRKAKAYFSEYCKSAVWRGPVERDQVHPTQKPLWLIERIVSASCPTSGVVLDCCMGSGTTGVACAHLNRRFIGIEIDAGYFEIARKRIQAEIDARDGRGSVPGVPSLFAEKSPP